jgi:rhamnosyltransferase
MSKSAIAIVITFLPDPDQIRRSLAAIRSEVDYLIVVDNGGLRATWLPKQDRIEVLPMPQNVGVAAAQNRGVEAALAKGAEHLVFYDQDSVPSEGSVGVLREAFDLLEGEGAKPAAVGPIIVDSLTGSAIPFSKVERTSQPEGKAKYAEAEFLIASGMLTSARRFQEVGPWEEGLFIDSVDFEWCFRARSKGYRCFGSQQAQLRHPVGDSGLWVRWGSRRGRLPVHSPMRRYYISRNRVHMYKRSYVPIDWKIRDLRRAMVELICFSLTSQQRWANAKATAKGVFDGLRSRYGPLEYAAYQK